MPLQKSKSKQAFSHNVEAEMNAGKPQKQALAIAYATKRRARKGYSKGGMVDPDVGPIPNESKSVKRYMDDEQSIGPIPESDKDAMRTDMVEHDSDMEAEARRSGLKHYASGGEVVDHDEVMEGDIDNFLSDEEDSFSPFQDQGIDADTDELSDKYGAPYDKLSNLDNQKDDEDQVQSRKGVLDSIMRRVRMRNMGR